jgi:chaperonin GroEL (HSP60 family)
VFPSIRGRPLIRFIEVLATQAIANIVKSSYGPSGLDKMMVDDIGDVTVTNDGATILSLLDVEHPAGKILVDLAQQQDKEVRDRPRVLDGTIQLLDGLFSLYDAAIFF